MKLERFTSRPLMGKSGTRLCQPMPTASSRSLPESPRTSLPTLIPRACWATSFVIASASSLGFYVAFMRPFTRAAFPEIVEAFRQFRQTHRWSVIEQARASGHAKAAAFAGQLVEIHEAGRERSPEWAIAEIQSRLISPLGIPGGTDEGPEWQPRGITDFWSIWIGNHQHKAQRARCTSPDRDIRMKISSRSSSFAPVACRRNRADFGCP